MQNRNAIFLSHTLSNETVGYGGKNQFQTKVIQSMTAGQSCNQSEWQLGNHIGTHIDAPFHFSEKGRTLDQYDAGFWIFDHVELCELPSEPSTIIGVGAWCEAIRPETELVLLRTGFEKLRNTEAYWAHNPGLGPELGAWLRVNRPNLRVLGMDFISVTSYDHRPLGRVAHHAFLHEENAGRPVMVIEDMKLSELKTSPARVVVAPMLVKDADGSPVTVIAEVGTHDV